MLEIFFQIEGEAQLSNALARLVDITGDLRPVWPLVSAELDRIEQEQFHSRGRGKWPPRKAQKDSGRPLERFSDRLFESVTRPLASDSVFRMTPDALTRGSSLPYAAAQHFGDSARGLPARPIYDLTDEDKARLQKVLSDELAGMSLRLGFEVTRGL